MILADISVLLILAIIKIWLYSYTAQMLSFGYAHWPWENCQENCFSFFQHNSGCPTNHMLISPICSKEATYPGHFGVILTSHFCVVTLKNDDSTVFLYN